MKSLLDARNRNIAARQNPAGGVTNSANGPVTGNPTTQKGIHAKPNPNQLATHISKRPLYIIAAVAGVAIYGGYEYIQHHNPLDGSGKTHQSSKIAPASGTNQPGVPPKKPKTLPAKPKTPDAYGHPLAPGAKEQSGQATTPGQATPAVPKKNPYAAQDAAFEASIGGSNGQDSNGLNWGQSAGASAAPAPAVAAQAATAPLEAEQAAVLAAEQQKNGKQKKPADDTSPTLVTREISPFELLQGTIIPAVLDDGIKSYIPGEISAVVSRNVYSSVNGATLLIPAGSKLVGTYNTQTTLGVNRLLAVWTRVEFPNGTTIDLPAFGAAGGKGYAGFAGNVNDHTWLIFKNAMLLSLVDIGMAVASPTSTSSNTTGVSGNEALQDGEQSLAQTFGQVEGQLLQKYIDIAPTITIPAGYVFNVVVSKDLVFPGPYNPAMQTGPARIETSHAPKPNPYALPGQS
nr:TrbI/VirB10 family protein [Acidithiobacillus montserratensis]